MMPLLTGSYESIQTNMFGSHQGTLDSKPGLVGSRAQIAQSVTDNDQIRFLMTDPRLTRWLRRKRHRLVPGSQTSSVLISRLFGFDTDLLRQKWICQQKPVKIRVKFRLQMILCLSLDCH